MATRDASVSGPAGAAQAAVAASYGVPAYLRRDVQAVVQDVWWEL